MTTTPAVLASHPFLAALPGTWAEHLAAGATLMPLQPDAYLAREGEAAESFYLIRSGRVAIELQHPLRGTVPVQTVGPGEVVGWSWLIPPHTWQFDARVVTAGEALAFEAVWLRAQLDAHPDVAVPALKEMLHVLAGRLAATRLHCLDLYR
ncbi:MAG TPA: Crp/Fnr family transcriptional regulator [Gemmatales bacterium]|mgnify:CR=1 FL=1|nr:Crp/Fnr family transcriptional regulator [Gemmatales bacterium]HMP58906.1 Crp/Fnr family transcriptional regulator [Gemmatales bacterium]